MGVAADQDIGRIADEGGGAADVGGENLRDQEGERVDLQGHGELYAHRDDQQHGGDIVEKSRNHRGDDLQKHRQDKDIAPGPAVGFIGHELEYPRFLQGPHKDHHPQEQEDDVQVDGPHGVFEGNDKKRLVEGSPGIGNKQEEGRAQKSHQGPVHQFKGNNHVNQQ